MSVATVILEQLGGNRFRAMTGAKSFIDCGDALMFMLPARFAKDGINKVRVTLTPRDTYRVEFFKVRAGNGVLVSEADDVYCDMLQGVFKAHTGLNTRL